MLKTGSAMVVTGKGYGQTNLIALDSDGAVLLDRTTACPAGEDGRRLAERDFARILCLQSRLHADGAAWRRSEELQRSRRRDLQPQRLRDGGPSAANNHVSAGAPLRRLIIDEPVSRAAVWSQRLAVFALLVAGVAVLLARVHAADPAAALIVFAAALIVAGFALMLAVAAASIIWRDGLRGAGQAFLGFVARGGAGRLSGLSRRARLRLAEDQRRLDRSRVPAARSCLRQGSGGGAASSRRPPGKRREPLRRTPTPTFGRSRSRWTRSRPTVCRFRSPTDLGWRIVDLQPPSPAGGGSGTIEAMDRTGSSAFPTTSSYASVLAQPRPRSTCGSVSRVGEHDFGGWRATHPQIHRRDQGSPAVR